MSRPGLIAAIFSGYPDFRTSVRDQLAARPRDAELLMLAFLASGVGFVTGLPGAAQTAAALDQPDALTGVLIGRVFAAVFLVPLFLFALSGLVHFAAKLFGGRGSFYTARVAMIWSVILALPLLVLNGLVSALMLYAPLAIVQVAAGTVSVLSGLIFLWILANGVAQAEAFDHSGRVFSVLLACVSAIVIFLVIVSG